MNLILFQRQYPNVNRLFRKIMKGDIDTLFLMARYDHIRGAMNDAFRGYSKGAEAGHATSMYYAAMEFFYGEVTRRSYRKALWFFMRAARLGEVRSREEYDRGDLKNFEGYFPAGAESAYMAGWMFEKGTGVKKNIYKAFNFYEIAFEQAAHSAAMVALASMQLRGMGPRVDREEAVNLLKKAAEMEDPDAFYKLGLLHTKNGALGEDTSISAEHFWSAGRRGHGLAAYRLACHLVKGEGVEQDLQAGLIWSKWADFLGERSSRDVIDEILPKLKKGEIEEAKYLFSKARLNYMRMGMFDAES